MTSTLIFDLDGLLADTERLHRRAYQDVLGAMGVAVSEAEYEEHWIRKGMGIGEFVEKHGLSIDPDAVRPAKSERYLELVLSSAEPMPGAVRALERLGPRKTLALATSSYEDAAHAVLKRLGIFERFSCIATRASVEKVKPFPDLFLWVADSLGVSPSECLVLEDAEKGIVAARAAGMRSIAVPNVHTRHNDFSGAAMVLRSLDELTVELIDNL